MHEANAELAEIYANPGQGHCFTQLRKKAGFRMSPNLTPEHDPLLKAIGRMIHVDDHERIEAWRDMLEDGHHNRLSSLSGRRHRLGQMLFAHLAGRRHSFDEADRILDVVRESAELRQEICDLLDILADRIRTVSEAVDPEGTMPLASHATYTLGEIAAAHDLADKQGRLALPREGVSWNEATRTDLLFVTLEKSEKDFSPTTRYATTRSRPHCSTGCRRIRLHRKPGLAGAMSNNVKGERMSCCSCVNARGMAG